MKSMRVVAGVALCLAASVALVACGSSSTKASSSGPTTVAGASKDSTGESSATTSATAPGKQVKMPTTGCLLTDQQASDLTGSPVTGSSTGQGPGGLFCVYNGNASQSMLTITVQSNPNPKQAHKLIDAVTATKAMYSDFTNIDAGDGGVAGCARGVCMARFTEGNVSVSISLRPGSLADVEKAATQAAATF